MSTVVVLDDAGGTAVGLQQFKFRTSVRRDVTARQQQYIYMVISLVLDHCTVFPVVHRHDI